MEYQTLDSREIYRNRWMSLREDAIARPSGQQGVYSVVEKNDFAVIAAVEGADIWLVQQYRYPVAARFWELPQGNCEDPTLPPLEVARRELREETGLQAEEMRHGGRLFLAYGFCTQAYDIYLASGLQQGERDLEPEEEGLICQRFALAEVEAMIVRGEIQDASTIAALGLLRMKGWL